MKRILFALLLLSACAPVVPPELKVKPVEVGIPVRDPCKPNLPAEPTYLDTADALKAEPHPDATARLQKNPADVSAMMDELANLDYLVGVYVQGRGQRITRENQLQAALKACE